MGGLGDLTRGFFEYYGAPVYASGAEIVLRGGAHLKEAPSSPSESDASASPPALPAQPPSAQPPTQNYVPASPPAVSAALSHAGPDRSLELTRQVPPETPPQEFTHSVEPPSSELPLPTPTIPPPKKKKKKRKNAKEVPPETPPQEFTHSVEPQLHTVSESGATPHTTAAAPSQQGQTNPPPSPQAHRSVSGVTSVVPPSSELPLPTPAIPPSKKKKKKKKKKAKEVPPETPPQDLTHSVEPQLHTVSESGATPHTTAAAPSQQGQTNPPPSPQAH